MIMHYNRRLLARRALATAAGLVLIACAELTADGSRRLQAARCFGAAIPDSVQVRFAGDQEWFDDTSEPIALFGAEYWRLGPVRQARDLKAEVAFATSYRSVPVYRPVDADQQLPMVVLIPVDSSCRYVQYVHESQIRQ